MPTQSDELRARVKRFAIRILTFVKTLPREVGTDDVARQLARSASSTSANYHSASRARSRAEFIARLGIVADEAGETEVWLEILGGAGAASGAEFDWLLGESHELRAIFVQAFATARLNQKGRKPGPSDRR